MAELYQNFLHIILIFWHSWKWKDYEAWHFAFFTLCYYSKEENHLFRMHHWGKKMCEADEKIILFFYLTFYIQNTGWFITLLGRRKQSFVIKNVKLFGSQGFVLCYVSHLISMTKVNVTMLKGAIFIWKLFDSHNKGIQRCIRPACLINNFTANPDKGKIQLIVYLYVVKQTP